MSLCKHNERMKNIAVKTVENDEALSCKRGLK